MSGMLIGELILWLIVAIIVIVVVVFAAAAYMIMKSDVAAIVADIEEF